MLTLTPQGNTRDLFQYENIKNLQRSRVNFLYVRLAFKAAAWSSPLRAAVTWQNCRFFILILTSVRRSTPAIDKKTLQKHCFACRSSNFCCTLLKNFYGLLQNASKNCPNEELVGKVTKFHFQTKQHLLLLKLAPHRDFSKARRQKAS